MEGPKRLSRLFSGNLPAMFLINFIGVNVEAGNKKLEKIWSDFVAEQNKKERKEWFFVHIAVFYRARNWGVKKILSERNILLTCGILKQYFSIFLVKKFGYDFVLILGWFW